MKNSTGTVVDMKHPSRVALLILLIIITIIEPIYCCSVQ